jgi:D-3-phosphoglycerate dehydrogenase
MTEPVTSFPKREIKVLLLENVHPSATELLRGEGFHVETVARALGEQELADRIRDIHVLGIRSKTRVTPAALAAAQRLLAVGCFCIGTNQVALRDAAARGVPVFNAPFSNTRSVAEMIIAEIVFLPPPGDRERGYTSAGPHMDDLTFALDARGAVPGLSRDSTGDASATRPLCGSA